MPTPPPTITSAFDAETFRQQGRAVIDQLADYLTSATARAEMPIFPVPNPHASLAAWPSELQGGDDPLALLAQAIEQSTHLHHPRYVGHQVCSPLPLSALCDMVSSLLNNGMAVYEMGPAATAMEHHVVRWLADAIGYGESAGGVLTSGGSLGNFTALLAARQAKAGADYWRAGHAETEQPLALLVSEQAHYCVKRAVQMMGWGEEGAVLVPSDDQFRMNPAKLAEAKQQAEAKGRRVIAVVASACSTATGSFDPIPAIADFCEAHDLWLHVDGAHGASFLLSDTHKHLLEGVERADSVVWDLHKMMMMPALATAVVFRHSQNSYRAFLQKASYLYQGSAEEEWFNVGQRTLECTKNMMALKAYVCLRTYGREFFAEYLDGMVATTHAFADALLQHGRFELGVPPACNIICFRYLPENLNGHSLDAMQTHIRNQILESGRYYLVQTRLSQGVFLRCTIINPMTTLDDLTELMTLVETTALALTTEKKHAA